MLFSTPTDPTERRRLLMAKLMEGMGKNTSQAPASEIADALMSKQEAAYNPSTLAMPPSGPPAAQPIDPRLVNLWSSELNGRLPSGVTENEMYRSQPMTPERGTDRYFETFEREIGPVRFREWQDMTAQDKNRVLDDYDGGTRGDRLFNPIDLRKMIGPDSRLDTGQDVPMGNLPQPMPSMYPQTSFVPGAEYQTAQTMDVGEQPIITDTPTFRTLRKQELALRNQVNGLGAILEEIQANPDLLDSAHTLTGRGQTSLLRLRDRLGIDAFDIGPEQEERLANVTAYKQQLLTEVNNYIKEITGATVGQGDETRRLMAVQANENDSPTQVIAKITNAMDMGRINIARRMLMQRDNGPAPSDSEMRQILSNRGSELYNQAKQQGMSPNDARMWAAQRLSEEYGL